MASEHVSVRMPRELIDELDAASERAGVSRSEMLKTLVEEGIRMQKHPGIVFRNGPTGRRAGLADGPDVWEVIAALRGSASDESIAQVAASTSVNEHQIRRALRYYGEFRAEINERNRRNDEAADRVYVDSLRQQALTSTG